MISSFEAIGTLFQEIGAGLKGKADVFMIGGAALLYQGMKPATKDIDLIVGTGGELKDVEAALKRIGFEGRSPSIEYKKMELGKILVRGDFRIDLFLKTVCNGFSLSGGMRSRAAKLHASGNLAVFLCSNEDIFLFKTLTEREGDMEDCISLAQRGLGWGAILGELQQQINASGNRIWITWVGERLDALEERGVVVPIKGEIDKIRTGYFEAYTRMP